MTADLATTRDLMEAVRAEMGDRWIVSLSWNGQDMNMLVRHVGRHVGHIVTFEPQDFAKPVDVLARDVGEYVRRVLQ